MEEVVGIHGDFRGVDGGEFGDSGESLEGRALGGDGAVGNGELADAAACAGIGEEDGP